MGRPLMVRDHAPIHCCRQRNDVPPSPGGPHKHKDSNCAESCESTPHKHPIGCVTVQQLHQMRIAVGDPVSTPLPASYDLIERLLSCVCGLPHICSQPS
jgi:hypothetical protein